MVIVVAGGLLLGIVVALNQLNFGTNQKNETEPVGVTEVCAALRDSSNDSLTKGDWERLTDWSDSKLQRYVLANCPEQYYRVD